MSPCQLSRRLGHVNVGVRQEYLGYRIVVLGRQLMKQQRIGNRNQPRPPTGLGKQEVDLVRCDCRYAAQRLEILDIERRPVADHQPALVTGDLFA